MYYNWEKNIDKKELNNIVKLILDGKIIVFPTETVYGIGANAFNEAAVKKVFEAKSRPQDNPLIVLVSKKEEIKSITKNVNEIEQSLIDNFMPGPFTLILEKNENIPDIVSAGLNVVGVRIPDNKIAQKIIETAKVPLVGPSANISGKPSGTKISDIKEELEEKVSAIIDGGESKIGIESTVVKVIDGIPTILRPGKITIKEIIKVTGKARLSEEVLKRVSEQEKIDSPGVKYKHYAPTTPCRLICSASEEKQIELMNEQILENNKDVVVLIFNEDVDKINIEKEKIISIGTRKDLNTVMKRIFEALRQADKYNAKIILIEGTKKEDLGLAIMNRLLKACQYDCIDEVKE